MKKMMFSAFAAAVLVTPALAGAQSPSPSPSPSTPPPTQTPSQTPPTATSPAPAAGESRSARAEKVTGELVKVDAVAKKITIKGADGTDTDFAYSDATDVGGGQDGVAGLATKAGTKVTVHYKSDMGTKTATKIEVDEKK